MNEDVPVIDRDVDIFAAGGTQGPTAADHVCSDCRKPFKKKVCLSLHRRKIHAAAYHREAKEDLQGKVPIKKRWTELESSNLAMYEARLIAGGFAGNINEELVHWIEDRTLDAIKSRRKNGKDKNMVKDFNDSLANETTDCCARSPSNSGWPKVR